VDALESIPDHVVEGGFWIRRRLALSLAHTDNADLGKRMMIDLLAGRSDWYLYSDLANVEIQTGNFEGAMEHLKKALNSNGPLRMKVKAVANMAQLLAQLGQTDQARTHAELAIAIRKEQTWGTDRDLEQLAASLGVALVRETGLVEAELRGFWRDGQHSQSRLDGVVKTVIAGGAAGFIGPVSGGEDLYFRMTDVAGRVLEIGDAVTFAVKPSYDKKKQRDSQMAVEISLAPPETD
jgi:cold shock CspA family protein